MHPRPTGPLSGIPNQIPPNAGPVTEQINKVAGKLVDFMRNSLEDVFKELATVGSPEAMIKSLQVSSLPYLISQKARMQKLNSALALDEITR